MKTELQGSPQLIGDTVYLTCAFLDKDGLPFDADNVTLEIFDDRWDKIGETITNLAAYKIGAGAYEYPFENPSKAGIIFKYTGYYNGIKNIVECQYPLAKI